jgi:phenylalanyl-tRNA synthetase beta chain
MKFTFGWLKEHLETEQPLEAIVERLSMLGLEVDSVEDKASALAAFTTARVKEAKAHPNADRLKVCIVETAGHGEVQVVCGAPNARSGMIGVFVPAGTYIPGTGLDLKKGVIRGVESNGMLVSEREVGISDEHEGIIELPEETPLGKPLAALLGLDDPVIDVAITPNRSDCLGVRGIARDLAAAGLGRLKPLRAESIAAAYKSPIQWRRDLGAAPEACPFVAGRHFRGLRNGPSPRWLQERLRAIGLRPISALVDITNFVTFDLGRPLHVFDAAKVKGDLVMRFARQGESLLALDGREYLLRDGMTVIADEAGVQGIGGIMGGEASGVTEETSEVFLEVALFDPVRTAATGRELAILSDARYRFERGIDPQSALWGPEVAARLILELCGGEASETVGAGELPDWRRSIELRVGRVSALGGLELGAGEQAQILENLGFEVTAKRAKLIAQVPSWRPDIDGEADLVEEVLRVKGYDEIPVMPLVRPTALPSSALSLHQRRIVRARNALAWRGLDEAVTFSFVSGELAALFRPVPERLRLVNPISSDLDVMRPSLLVHLLLAAQRNADRGFGDLALFEIGPEYRDDTPEGQLTVAGGLRSGEANARHWALRQRLVDAFDAKADALATLSAAGAPVENLQTSTDAPAWYHPGRSGVLRLGATVLACFGELHPRILRRLDLRGPVVGFEVYLDAIPEPKRASKQRRALEASALQPVRRDFAFVVAESVAAETLIRAAKGAERKLIADVALFDVYRGHGIPEGHKSLALEVTLQPQDHTLTDAELEAVAKKIVVQVEKATGGSLRG